PVVQQKSNQHIHFVSVQEEKKKAMMNEMIAKLTDTCWDKCITGSIGSSFSNSETSCLSNCAKRFIDVKMLTMQRANSSS
uniref:Mitochondrial import inner membrane translocase subunit n=1 Tax=Aegilops tauschii subsp. strangulata TaxID=200361 RepID=A0A453HPY7_AEGTS